MGESVRDPSSSFCNSPSPPPSYTPLPLSGHVTLMYGQSSSPAKRQDSIQSTTTRDEYEVALGSVLEGSFRGRERRESGTSHRRISREGDVEVQQAAAEMSRQPSTDMSSTLVPCDSTRTENDEQEVTAEQSHDSSFPWDQESLRPARLEILSSSVPATRPPSPFPRSRSLSFQLPPLRTIQQPEPHPLPPPPELLVQPFRLPPLRELPPLLDTHGSGSGRRKRGRSHSCQLQTSTLLSSVREQSAVTVVQS